MALIARKAAFVTGAARGIGLGIADTLAEAGLKVALADLQIELARQEAARLRERGFEAVSVELDVASSDSWRRAVEEASSQLGPLDVLVNNAGISPRGTAVATDEPLWEKTLAINLKGPWLGVKALLPSLQEQRGAVINIGSTHATLPHAHLFAYGVSKAGLLGLTRQIAVEFLHDGITCNMIAPGWVASPGEKEIQAREGRPDFPAGIANMSTPADVGAAVVYLISEAARRVTGEVLHLDGGLHFLGDVKLVHFPHER